jgi:hypothetical protein
VRPATGLGSRIAKMSRLAETFIIPFTPFFATNEKRKKMQENPKFILP